MNPLTFSNCFNQFSGIVHDYDRKITLSSQQFRNKVCKLQERIEELSGKECMFVLLSMRNSLNFMIGFFGIINAGSIPIIAGKDLLPFDIQLYQKKCMPNIMLSDYSLKSLEENSVIIEENPLSICGSLIHCVKMHTDIAASMRLREKYGVFILHPTSGTTGVSRLCIRDEKGCLAEPMNHIASNDGYSIQSMLCVLPLYHAYGFGSGFLLGMLLSCDMHLISGFNPRKVANILSNTVIDYMPANPPVLGLLLHMYHKMIMHMPKIIISAGSMLKKQLVEEFYDKYGVYIKASYGSTETGEISLQRMDGIFPDGCVGKPLVHTKIDIRNIDGIDTLFVNNPSLMNGYLMDDCRTDASLIGEDGFFPTKDMALVDDAQMITLLGRADDVMNIFGIKIIPKEIENVLNSFPSVKECYVYSRADEKGYEEIYAVVDTEHTMEKLLDLCRKNLNTHKIPKNIFIKPVPKSDTGKILKDKLP